MRTFALIAMARSVSSAEVASLQAPHGDYLFVPIGAIICQASTPNPTDSGVLVLRVVEQSADSMPEGRTLVASFDSSGVAVSLLVMAFERTAGGKDRIHGIKVKFGNPEVGIRTVVDETNVPVPGTNPILKEIPLTEAEMRRAHALANWLWNHKCARVPPGPNR
jgi:hypothetical protein